MTTLEDRLRAALAAKSAAVTLDEPVHRTPAVPAARTVTIPAARHVTMPAEVIPLRPAGASRPARRAPSLLAAVAAVVFALAVATVVAGRSHRPGPGHAVSRAEIPWSQVGPDWTLTVSTTASDVNGTLLLLDPSGQRYQICLLPASFRQLEQWSFGTGRALVTRDSVSSTSVGQVLLVNLRTGSQVKL